MELDSVKKDLDDVVLLQIFSLLTLKDLKKAAIVNKKWNNLAGILIKDRKIFHSETYIGGDKWTKISRNDREIMVVEKKDFIYEYKQFLRPFNFSRPRVMLCFLTSDFYSLESIICENGIPILNETSNRTTYPVVKCRLVLSAVAKIITQLMPQVMPYLQSLFVVGGSILSNDLKNYHGNSIRQCKLGLEPCRPAIASLIFPDKPGSFRFVNRQVVNDPNMISRFVYI